MGEESSSDQQTVVVEPPPVIKTKKVKVEEVVFAKEEVKADGAAINLAGEKKPRKSKKEFIPELIGEKPLKPLDRVK